MKWRLIDRVDSFEPWRSIAGRKTISFEEYSLLKVFGRKGSFPESLVLESCVELARWLAAASSGFSQTAALAEVETFRFTAEADRSEVLRISARVVARERNLLRLECAVATSAGEVAAGRFTVELLPLGEHFDTEWVTGLWRELCGETHAQA
ncbi:MAG: hypothetical protein NTW87_35980 [Planctomycetota bacterium]|nr:hypothetical protein [Planctomycetota bacterium]